MGLFAEHGLYFIVFLGPFLAFDAFAIWFLVQAVRGQF